MKPLNFEQKSALISAMREAGITSTSAIAVLNALPFAPTPVEERDSRDATARARAHAVAEQAELQARVHLHHAEEEAKMKAKHGW